MAESRFHTAARVGALFGLWWLILQAFAILVSNRFQLAGQDTAYSWLGQTRLAKTEGWSGFVNLHNRWDSGFYVWIAQDGYVRDTAAFLPLYPACIRLGALVWGALTRDEADENVYAAAAFVVSNLSALGAAVGLYALARLDLDETGAQQALFYFLIFPTAFFLTAIYTEALFVFWAILSFYAARRRWWALAGGAGACAALTRVAGLGLFPALLIEWRLERRAYPWKWAWLLLIPLAFAAYELYLRSQNLSFFVSQQEVFGRWPLNPLALPDNIEWAHLQTHPMAQAHRALEAGLGALTLIAAFMAGRRMRLSYGLFSSLCILGPLSTGTLLGLERFALTAFPTFLLLARYRPLAWLDRAYTLGAILLLALYTLLFVHGYWAG